MVACLFTFFVLCLEVGKEGGRLGHLVYLQIANAENIQVLKILHMLVCLISPVPSCLGPLETGNYAIVDGTEANTDCTVIV